MRVCRFLEAIGTPSETDMVDMPQVFLPCAADTKGQTLSEPVQAHQRFGVGQGQEGEGDPFSLRWDNDIGLVFVGIFLLFVEEAYASALMSVQASSRYG